ncbi:MAG: hypothetical protein SFV55_03755 [Haliscomenobacter sp.]|uniref:hypothetical protein n=1 Tax=Haliscomenobacter sp. TaxID=2717303 RepID=UPI0029B90DE5|nr:hypothetical protein [Haliscomenobacter sp.]MDX2067515.1 hypothetical protein [Haliscomenobacter sp.]
MRYPSIQWFNPKYFTSTVLLQTAACGLLLGRAWQHLFWDAPYREFLWDEYWMKDFVSLILGLSWSEYVGNPLYDERIQLFSKGLGYFYLLAAGAAVGIKWFPRLARTILSAASGTLLILALIVWKEQGWQIGQLLEQSLQWATPLLLVANNKSTIPKQWVLLGARVIISCTFIGHGMYALGYYPIPGNFLEMTMRSLSIGEYPARQFLLLIGVLDVLAALGVLRPKRLKTAIFAYLIAWGLLTSLARVWGYFSLEFIENWLQMWLYELFIRFPHFMVPWFLWLEEKK